MRTFRIGRDPNILSLVVSSVDIDHAPVAQDVGFLIKVTNYNLDDVLVQLLEDYGEDRLIDRLKFLCE